MTASSVCNAHPQNVVATATAGAANRLVRESNLRSMYPTLYDVVNFGVRNTYLLEQRLQQTMQAGHFRVHAECKCNFLTDVLVRHFTAKTHHTSSPFSMYGNDRSLHDRPLARRKTSGLSISLVCLYTYAGTQKGSAELSSENLLGHLHFKSHTPHPVKYYTALLLVPCLQLKKSPQRNLCRVLCVAIFDFVMGNARAYK